MSALLEVESLSVAHGDLVALREVSFRIEAGEAFVLLGANGAGKTTLLRCISGLVRPRSGSVSTSGRSLLGLQPFQVARLGIAHVPEGRRVFTHLSVEDNLAASFIDARAPGRTLRQMLEEIYFLFPRLGERHRQTAGTMSGGEQQMLAIGRALMASPVLLMLDEPSLGLSPLMADLVFERLEVIRGRGTAILLVEQNASAFELADRGLMLSNGRVVLQGGRQALEDSELVRRTYLGA